MVGPNGVGKTTLAKSVAGLLPVVQGSIRYHAFGRLSPRDAIAYVASDARRDLWRRESELAHARGFAGRYHERTTVAEWLGRHCDGLHSAPPEPSGPAGIVSRFGLARLLDKPLTSLSTGESSRLLVARALLGRPRMLILDEPCEGLDRPGRAELVAMLDGLAASGMPTVMVTHRAEEMLPATTHVLVMNAGRIVGIEAAGRRPQAWRRAMSVGSGRRSAPPDTNQPRTAACPRRSAQPPIIEMQAATVRYGDAVVLDRLNWRVADGENWAVTGPNGAGKSTLLKLITGECLQVHANRIRLFGKVRGAEQTLWDVRERLGVVSHDLAAAYQKQLSAADVVCSGFFDSIGLYRRCDAKQRAAAAAWLDRMGIVALGAAPFNRLSQGQRQMVLIARAMVKSPQVLILDEPCAGLDADNRHRVLEVVTRIGDRDATGLIFVSHHENEIPDCTTHRLSLDGGRAVFSGPIGRR